MADEQEKTLPQEDEAASAPSASEELDAAIDGNLGFGTDPSEQSAAANPEPEEPDTSAEQSPAPSLKDAAEARPAGDTPPASETPQDDDIWKDADPKYRDAYQQAMRDAQLRLEGVKGRHSASDKALQEARARIAELEARGGQQPGSQDSEDQGGEPEVDRDKILKDLREEYPDVAGPLLDHMANLEEKLARLEQPVGRLEQQEQASALEAQAQIVLSKHEDWPQVRSDDRLAGWAQSQPRAVQEAMQRNAEFIVDGNEVAWVVDLFKRDMGIGGQSSPESRPDPNLERRERQMKNGRDAGTGSGPSVATGIPKDLDGAIDYYMSKSATG